MFSVEELTGNLNGALVMFRTGPDMAVQILGGAWSVAPPVSTRNDMCTVATSRSRLCVQPRSSP